MADQDDDSPLVSMARGIYKGANDLINKIPTPGLKSSQESDHDVAIKQMNKQANDKTVADANKTYIPTQTAAQKKGTPAPTPGKTMIKPAQRKR